jgi:hypothetical protein
MRKDGEPERRTAIGNSGLTDRRAQQRGLGFRRRRLFCLLSCHVKKRTQQRKTKSGADRFPDAATLGHVGSGKKVTGGFFVLFFSNSQKI